MKITCATGPMPLRFMGALAGVSLSLLLSSCGGGDKTDSAASDSTGTASTTTATTAGATTDTKTASSDSSSTSPTTSAASGDTKTASASDSSGSGSGATPDGWKSYSAEDGTYTASFPDTPKTQSQKIPGKDIDMKIVAAEKNGDAYMVTTMPFGQTLDKAQAEKALEGGAKSLGAGGTIVSDDKTTFQGQAAHDIIVEKAVGGKPAEFHDMTFVVKDHLYQIMTVLAKASTNADDHKKFQDTFKLTTK